MFHQYAIWLSRPGHGLPCSVTDVAHHIKLLCGVSVFRALGMRILWRLWRALGAQFG